MYNAEEKAYYYFMSNTAMAESIGGYRVTGERHVDPLVHHHPGRGWRLVTVHRLSGKIVAESWMYEGAAKPARVF